jgi:hypothetical protein
LNQNQQGDHIVGGQEWEIATALGVLPIVFASAITSGFPRCRRPKGVRQ